MLKQKLFNNLLFFFLDQLLFVLFFFFGHSNICRVYNRVNIFTIREKQSPGHTCSKHSGMKPFTVLQSRLR